MESQTNNLIESLAFSSIEQALELLRLEEIAEVCLYSKVHVNRFSLPHRYFNIACAESKIGGIIDQLLDIDEEGQAIYISGGFSQVRCDWQVAASRKYPGLYSLSEAASTLVGDSLAQRGSILVSPHLDLTDKNSPNFNHFFEVIKHDL